MKKFLLSIWYTLLYQFDQHRYEIPEWWYAAKPFNEQPDWMQRVTIAQDVIAQVRMNRFKASKGSYVENIETTHIGLGDDVKKNFEKIQTCEVCGLGACFMSLVKFKNTINFSELNDIENDGDFFRVNQKVRSLLSLFSPTQLYLIEIAFEERVYITFYAERLKGYNDVSEEEIYRAENFGYNNDYTNSNDRLIGIMQNIIDNKGTFKP